MFSLLPLIRASELLEYDTELTVNESRSTKDGYGMVKNETHPVREFTWSAKSSQRSVSMLQEKPENASFAQEQRNDNWG